MIDLTRLHQQLVTSDIQIKNPALYQVINQLIRAAAELQKESEKSINNVVNSVIVASNLDYLTHTDEHLPLPNSRQLIAGTGVTFDDTLVNQRVVNVTPVSSGGSEWSVLTDGDLIEPELIFASGEVIMTHVP